ncbi:MAG: acyltransferase family protein [Pseudomonadota bacterium]
MSAPGADQYRADIDGLRALAVIAVIIFHAFPSSLKGGFVGVDVFFVISGYLISGIVLRQLQAGTFSFARFYGRRIRRIFPALSLVLVAVLAFGYFALLAQEYQQLGRHVGAGAAFISNLMLWREAGYFDQASETKPLLHLWSLAVEEQFYLIWPGLLYVCWRWKPRMVPMLLAVTLLSFAANLIGLRYARSVMFFSPMTRFWELSAGALLAYHHLHQRQALPVKWRHGLSWVGLALILAACVLLRSNYAFPGLWALLPVLGACCIIAAGAQAQVNRWLLANRWMVAIGLISYPLYLWHWPLLSFMRILYSAPPPVAVRWACVAVSVLLAVATYRLVERPIRFGAHAPRKTVLLCVAMLLIGLLGAGIALRHGLPGRASVAHYADNAAELVRPADTDPACLAYVGTPIRFPYCRYQDAGAKRTVALIGDSHAQVTFTGMGEALAARHRNLVMLANSGCPPLVGAVTGDTPPAREKCSAQIAQMMALLVAKRDITDVFIVTRGPIYRTGNGYGETEKDYRDKPIQTDNPAWAGLPPTVIFDRGLAATVAVLKRAGKRVYYVLENPETGIDPALCITRPLRRQGKDCTVPLAAVMERQGEYRTAVQKIAGVTFIDPLPAFCPDGLCRMRHDGTLLYVDDDHFSVTGSRFLTQHVLQDYLPR